MLTLYNSNSFYDEQENNKNHACQKPLEIYSVIDPLCPECWSLEPVIKKLQVQYGHYFTLRHFVSGSLESLNTYVPRKKGINTAEQIAEKWEKTASLSGMSCDGDVWLENPISAPHKATLAIKAAELQGKQQGMKFLRKLRENLFLNKQNIGNDDVLLDIARSVNLDEDEFLSDLSSEATIKALRCDLKFSQEMDVTQIPTLIVFNDKTDDDGIKISGCYSYDVYVQILKEMTEVPLEPAPLPELEDFLSSYSFVATKEVSVVYQISCEEAEKRLKRLVLQQKVERVPVKYGTFWRYLPNR
ncbi:ClpXP adapter SpxH family protein [Fictibacillus sp. 26RED30]|uniref:ClpXP adapter SpxH family protein n=1 Tax=Fictibacillus sp. 26RED30 TaxID=2745877 RepID=UPI0018CD9D97|nr:ClpXP adapter SpxH family protein [Fictibacillus sp. 26RED30]MBH0161206.1 DsbA family protein [Fictibacillus sp. 26RED30]